MIMVARGKALWEIEGEVFVANVITTYDPFGCPNGRRHVCAASDLEAYLAAPAGAAFAEEK